MVTRTVIILVSHIVADTTTVHWVSVCLYLFTRRIRAHMTKQGNCCYDQGDYRCDAEMYNAFDAGGNAKNTLHCCSDVFPCTLGEGDCDHDSDCVTGLVCGSDNCDFGTSSHDCCTLEDTPCEDDSDCEGELIFCGVENCLEGAGNCCYYRGEHRCDGKNTALLPGVSPRSHSRSPPSSR